MPRFHFRLQALLKYRRYRRDLCRQYLGDALAAEAAKEQERAAIEQNVAQQLTEMQGLMTSGRVSIDAAAARRYYATRLVADLRSMDQQLKLLAAQVAQLRAALVLADQQVKMLERLEDQQRTTHRQEEERRTGRELEDAWLANHLREAAR